MSCSFSLQGFPKEGSKTAVRGAGSRGWCGPQPSSARTRPLEPAPRPSKARTENREKERETCVGSPAIGARGGPWMSDLFKEKGAAGCRSISRGSQEPALREGHASIACDDHVIEHADFDKRQRLAQLERDRAVGF